MGLRKSLRRGSWLIALALLALPARAAGQSITTGSISGTVRSAAGSSLAGAFVTLSETGSGASRFVETGADGSFAFQLLPPGTYDLVVEQLRHRPRRVRAIVIEPGSKLTVNAILEVASPPVTSIDSTTYGSGAAGASPGAARSVPPVGFDRFPLPERTMAATLALSPIAGPDGVAEGLPLSFARSAVDGTPALRAVHQFLPADELAAASHWGLERVMDLWAPTDVEWGGTAGSILNGSPRRGARGVTGRLWADWSGSAGASSRFFDPNAASHSSFRGGVMVSGALVRDTLHFSLGAEAERLQTPLPAAWVDAGADSGFAAAVDQDYGVDLLPYLTTRVAERKRIAAFGRLDGRIGGGSLRLWTGFGKTEDRLPDVGLRGTTGVGTRKDGIDVAATGVFTTTISRLIAQELRVGFSRSSREYLDGPVAATRIGGGPISFGTDPALPGDFAVTDVRMSEALHVNMGATRVKLGVSANYGAHDRTYQFGRSGEYLFANQAAFSSGTGVASLTSGTPAPAKFSVLGLGAFLQNEWSPAPQVTLIIGLRFDAEMLPEREIPFSQSWFDLTEIRNDSLKAFQYRLSPRFGFRWSFGEADDWVVEGGAGLYHGGVDPVVLAEVIAESGQTLVHRGVGSVTWNEPSDLGGTTQIGSRLSLPGPDLQAPRSARFRFGLARRLGRGGALEVAASYRHTDFLTRRHDLNRLPGPASRDQYGRPVYGELSQQGEFLMADPGSNRRFEGFEMVSALDPDGYSDFVALTTRVDLPMGRFLTLLGSHTYSRTTDNWLTGGALGPYAQLTPFPDSLADGSDWAEGTSDYDIPHRVVVGIEMMPLGRAGFSIAALYRYRSGLPFTPGHRYGVDANADGSVSNDPAYVDPNLNGMDALLAGWACLTPLRNDFATRNACRDPAVSSLDVRLGLGPVVVGGYPIEVWVEALNVTSVGEPVYDHALVLVDAAQSVTTDPTAGTVTVPLVANPGFGQPLAYRGAGRALRLGLRVNY